MTTTEKKPIPKLCIPCPFCGEAAKIKACRMDRDHPDYYWKCTCEARGFIPDAHFKQLERHKKVSFTS